jgi:hypothetical protein
MRRNSRMSLGSTQPGMMFTWLRLRPVASAEVLDDALHHVGEAGHVRADVTRRVGVNHVLAGRDLALLARLGDDLHDVVADGLRKTSGVNGDDIRVIQREHVGDGLQQVRLAAENRRAFGERAGAGHHRFLVVPGERAAMIGAASLRPVAMGQAVMHPQGGIHGPDWLAGFGRIDGQSGAFHDVRRRMPQ